MYSSSPLTRPLLVNYVDRYLRMPDMFGPQKSASGSGPSGQHRNLPNVWFVVSQAGKHNQAVDGSDNNDGRDPSLPLLTVQKAIDNAVSGRGDIIMVSPGSYPENLSVSQKHYLTLMAWVPGGYGRPDIDPDTGVSLTIDRSQGFSAIGIRFYSADSDTVKIDSNGFLFEDCVFDGDTGQAATEALVRHEGDATDDDFTASEGVYRDCLFRNSNGFGLAIESSSTAPATNGVGTTHMVMERCRFIDNVAEDIIVLATTVGGAYGLQDCVFHECWFMSKNKATHIDIQTNLGAANAGNVFSKCFIFDDTIDTTAIKAAGTGSGFIGCYSLDGVIDGDALD